LTKTADVVVIGGGVVGSAIAYFLSRAKLKVTLVEKGCAAGGTSGKCDGNVAIYDALPGYGCQMNKMSQDMFPAMAEELEDDIEWTRKGSVVLIENEAEMAFAQAHCREMVAYGMPFRIMDSNEVREDEPNSIHKPPAMPVRI
jgi:sarcosine oxidase subunit beta